MHENIVISGITDFDYYPSNLIASICKSNVVSRVLVLPEEKPDIESLNEIKIDVEVNEYTVIRTILGPKLVVHGSLNAKVLYVANNAEQSVHSSKHSILFSDFVLLSDISSERPHYTLNGVFIGVENVHVNSYDERSVNVSSLYLICPKVYRSGTNTDGDDLSRYYACDNSTTNASARPYRMENEAGQYNFRNISRNSTNRNTANRIANSLNRFNN